MNSDSSPEKTKDDNDKLTGKVLVVDDNSENRALIRCLLEGYGHEVSEVDNGKSAIERVRDNPPDVVLLDVLMPEMDGFEVVQHLKSNPDTAAVPVLMLSSLTERKDMLKGIESGANDFLIKPIDIQEVPIRIKNAIYTKRLYDEVQNDYKRLERLKSLGDNLTHMIVHDMRRPLFGIGGYLELLQQDAEAILTDNQKHFLEEALAYSHEMEEMVNALLDITQMENNELLLHKQPSDLQELTNSAIKAMGTLSEKNKIAINIKEPVKVLCDPDIIRRTIINLIGNALKFSLRNEEVVISISQDNGIAKLEISDCGPGIPIEYHEKIFEKFGIVEAKTENKVNSSGLGLAFCKLAVTLHGGNIGLRSELGKGSVFWITLPETLS